MDEVVQIGVEDTQKDKFLTFSIGEEQYGIEINYVTEIIGIQRITEIPEQPKYVKGVINLRGKIIPTLDVRLRFNKDEREYDNRTCIIVVNVKEIAVGIVVDRVLEVINITKENISPPPKFNGDFTNKYIKGIGKVEEKITILIDCDKLLKEDEIEEIKQLDEVK